MPLPAIGKYRLTPTHLNGTPIPPAFSILTMDVEVVVGPPPALKCALGLLSYAVAQDAFTIAPDCGIVCNGDGTYHAVLPGPAPLYAPMVISGGCVPLP